MRASPRARAAFLALLLGALALHWDYMRSTANTFDETSYMVEGLLLLKTGDFSLTAHRNPPAAKYLAALPFLLSGVRPPAAPPPVDTNRLGFEFLYRREGPPSRPILMARAPMLVFVLLMGGAVFLWSSTLWGGGAALAAAAAWAVNPSFLAHGSLVTGDYAAAALVLWTLFALWLYARRPSDAGAWAAGALWGLSLACKGTALLAGPAFALVFFLPEPPGGACSLRARRFGSALLAAVVVACAFYRFSIYWWLEDLGFHLLQASKTGYQTYFWGAMRPFGSRGFYLVSYLVKTPLGWIFLSAAAVWAVLADAQERRRLLPALATVLAVFAAATLSRSQAGNRYLLPAYALLCVLIGGLWARPRWRPAVVTCLLACAASVLWKRHYLAYANEPAEAKLASIFGESDVDWGQDLPELARWAAARPGVRVDLCYFGLADPEKWGLRAQMLPIPPTASIVHRDYVHPVGPGIEYLAMSVTALQRHPLRNGFFWAAQPPDADIGGSIYLWDISRRPDMHKALAGWYRAFGWAASAEREEAQAAFIAGKKT